MTRRGWIAASAVGAAVLLLLWVTNSAAVRVVGSPQDPFEMPTVRARPQAPTEPTATGTQTAATLPVAPRGGTTVVGLLLEILFVVVVVAIVAAVLSYLLVLLRSRRDRTQDTEFETLPEVPSTVVEDADGRLVALAEGDPRNAIVACWLRLETAVAQSGMPRRPSETSAEFTTRVLLRWNVDRVAITDLARLYREARFSRHALGEPVRAEALTALRRVHEDLRRAAPTEEQVL